jgi:hypothetical protein
VIGAALLLQIGHRLKAILQALARLCDRPIEALCHLVQPAVLCRHDLDALAQPLDEARLLGKMRYLVPYRADLQLPRALHLPVFLATLLVPLFDHVDQLEPQLFRALHQLIDAAGQHRKSGSRLSKRPELLLEAGNPLRLGLYPLLKRCNQRLVLAPFLVQPLEHLAGLGHVHRHRDSPYTHSRCGHYSIIPTM